jgi:hypothetical protein
MTARTYYPDREPTFAEKPRPETPFTDPDPDVIRYGYTLRDLHRLTATAVRADRSMALDVADARDIAWSSIAEHLCAADEPPHPNELVQAGWQGIYRTVRESYRSRGYSDGNYGDEPTMPRFAKFWGSGVTPSHEDGIVERVAADQVLGTLTATYRDAITALALTDDYLKAANLLGINYSAFTVRIATARRRILALWHEGETPHRTRRTDRRVESHSATLATHCGRGHEWTPENTRIRHRMVRGNPKRDRTCRQCEHDRGAARRGKDAA